MIYTTITIGGHLVQRILCDEQGGSISMPPLYPSQYQFKLKLVTIADDGGTTLAYPNVTALSASIGLVYAEPRAGTFKLGYNGSSGTLTEQITFNEDAGDFMTKLIALPESVTRGLSQIYQPTPSTWMCKFSNPGLLPIPLVGYEVELEPETFVRVRQFYQNEDYWVEIRLMQGPIASTSAHDTVLSDPPTIREIRRGYTDTDASGLTTIKVNEVQAVRVPPGFQGTYILKFQGRQTRPLSVNDGAANVQTALNAMYTGETPALTRFTVTNPEVNNAYVEFVGPLEGQPFICAPVGQNLGIIVNVDASHSTLVFDLDLNTTEVADALRNSAEVDATFEINLHITDPSIPDPPGDPGQDIVLFQAPVRILRPLHWEGLEAAAPINWLYPPNPKDYIPFDVSQVITGHQSYAVSFGDGLATTFAINHMLNAEAIDVAIRANGSGGRLLNPDEYTIHFDNSNALTITITPAPAVNSLLLMLISHGDVSAFLDHTHTIEQIQYLPGVLDEIMVRLSTLEAYIPVTGGGGDGKGKPPFGGTPTTNLIDVTIPDIWNVVPTNRMPGKDKPTDPSKLPSQGLLLPAVHDAIPLLNFTANASTDLITLATPHTLVDGQRVRIDAASYSVIGNPTFINNSDPTTPSRVVLTAHGLVDGRRVQFSGEGFPTSIARFFTYYVINSDANTFQIASTPAGNVLPILGDADPDEVQFVSTRPEPPTPLTDGVDYFVISPTASPTTFKLAASLVTNPTPPPATMAGPFIDLQDDGYPTPVPMTMSTIEDAPPLDQGRLPLATDENSAQYIGHAFSIREQVPLMGGRGIRATTVYPGDIVASDGRLWYPVTRSDSPGLNSFYPTKMENEIFRLAINDHMLKPGTVLTVTFDLEIRMYKHTSNIQYLLVIEWADLPSVLDPAPTGPNIYAVDWSNRVPILKQKLIVTELSFLHEFGAQVVRTVDNRMATNKKAYGVQVAGDSIPPSANFAIRGRLIEFDTEDNVKDAQGLVYYAISKGKAIITTGTPETPTPP